MTQSEEKRLIRNVDKSRIPQEMLCSALLDKVSTSGKVICNRSALLSLATAQLICLCFSAGSTICVFLQHQGINVPLFQNFNTYFLMSLIFTVALAYRGPERGLKHVLEEHWWQFLLMAVFDVEANFFTVSSFKYTSATSEQVSQSFMLPAIMFLSFFILKTRYKLLNYIGAGVSIAGLIVMIVSDYIARGPTDSYASNEVLGDVLSMIGALLFALENVTVEYLMGDCDIVEFLGSFSMFSLLISSVQMLVLERDLIAAIDFTSITIVLPFTGFAICMLTVYVLLPLLVKHTSATWLGINNLSVNFYITIVGIFVFHYKLPYLYFVAFSLIIIGALLYATQQPVTRSSQLELSISANDPVKRSPEEIQPILHSPNTT